MPSAERTFLVHAPQSEVWALLSDFAQLGPCVPGCRDVEVLNPDDARWQMEVSLGLLRKRFVVETHTTVRQEPSRAEWVGDSDLLSTAGRVELRSREDDVTDVTYRGSVRAKGAIRHVLNRYFRKRLDRDIEEFVQNVRARLDPNTIAADEERMTPCPSADGT